MFSTKRLKKKSQSVDIGSQGFSPTLVPASPLNKASPPVAKTIAVQENNTTNSQKRNPRVGELKRGYTIETISGNVALGAPSILALTRLRKGLGGTE